MEGAIKSVQEKEEQARKKLEEANARRAEMISKAQGESDRLIDEAVQKAGELKEKETKELDAELAKEDRKRIEEAEKAAARKKKATITKTAEKRISDAILKQIVG